MRYTIGKKNDEKKVKLYTQKLAKNGVKIFRSSIDWMTLRIDDENCEFLQKLTYLVNNSPSIDLEFGGFLFYYVRDIASSACSIYELRDTVGNTLGSVLYVRNKAVGNKFTHLALGGTFWTFYPQFFEVFLDLFQIDKNSPHVLARVDYAVDIQGICVDDILRDYRKPSKGYGKGWVEQRGDINVWKLEKSSSNSLVLYNKPLQILEEWLYKKKDNDWDSPYDKYMDNGAISRFEYRMHTNAFKVSKSHKGHTINEIMNTISQLHSDYVKERYYIDILALSGENQRVQNPKRDNFFEEKLKDKTIFFEKMIRWFSNSLRDLHGDDYFYEFLAEYIGNDWAEKVKRFSENSFDNIF